MLYGVRDGETMILIAADTTAELDAFVEKAPAALELEEVDAFTIMIDDTYKGLNRAYRCRADSVEVVEVSPVRAPDVQRNMLAEGEEDIYRTGSTEERTIAEIHGLDKFDPFDDRDDAEREQDAKIRAMEDEYRNKKNGKPGATGMTGESFSARRDKNDVSVTDIRGTVDKDTGKVTISDVIAQKGLWGNRDEPLVEEPGTYWQVTVTNTLGNDIAAVANMFAPEVAVYQAATEDGALFWFKDEAIAQSVATELGDQFVHVGEVFVEAVDEFGITANKMRINSTTFKTFYRLDVHGITPEEFDALIARMPIIELDKLIADRGEFDEEGSTGVWTASGILRLAEKLNETVRGLESSLVTEVYAVNRENERLVPKGVQVVDTEAPREIGPRPWNDRAAEWHAWTDEERADEIKKNVKGDEFIYAGSGAGSSVVRGTLIYIAPKSYFDEHGTMWSEKLPIEHLMPRDVKELEPGVYEDRNRDWNNASHTVGRTGMRESMMLRIFLNHL